MPRRVLLSKCAIQKLISDPPAFHDDGTASKRSADGRPGNISLKFGSRILKDDDKDDDGVRRPIIPRDLCFEKKIASIKIR